MAKEYKVRCPYCGNVRKMMLSNTNGLLANTTGIRGVQENIATPVSSESLDEENWIDLTNPCPACHHKFSFNLVSGESRE